jgi:hypothetical protein
MLAEENLLMVVVAMRLEGVMLAEGQTVGVILAVMVVAMQVAMAVVKVAVRLEVVLKLAVVKLAGMEEEWQGLPVEET